MKTSCYGKDAGMVVSIRQAARKAEQCLAVERLHFLLSQSLPPRALSAGAKDTAATAGSIFSLKKNNSLVQKLLLIFAICLLHQWVFQVLCQHLHHSYLQVSSNWLVPLNSCLFLVSSQRTIGERGQLEAWVKLCVRMRPKGLMLSVGFEIGGGAACSRSSC